MDPELEEWAEGLLEPELDSNVQPYYEAHVLPKLASPGPDSIASFMAPWMKPRYQHIRTMPKPSMRDLRESMKKNFVNYKIEGNSVTLSMVIEFRDDDGYRVNLKWLSGKSMKQPGSYRFQSLKRKAWLLVDVVHLIMLMAEQVLAPYAMVKKWFQESKKLLEVL